MNYCFRDGYVCTLLTIQYKLASPSPMKLNRVKMNRNSLGLNLKVVWNTLLCLKTSVIRSDLQFLMRFIAKIEKALSVAWGVACGYLFENLRIFWNLRKFLPEA
ncbi:hypothetical protein T07_10044 [Trichinella nelsoni]|uniref:Uncharacterized protein n=1 Tax=Trichinella nelsoni TaxID=6336 RepID=A0A0V0S5C9_9BILA|nr:hypothetical protein T07_10044 [Trichinella nelsoni]